MSAMRRASLLLAVGCLLGCAPRDKVPEEAVHPDASVEAGADAEAGVGPTYDASLADSADGGEPGDEGDGEIPEATTYDGPAGEGEPCNPALDSCQLPLKCCPGNPLGPDGGPTYTCLQPLGIQPHCPPILASQAPLGLPARLREGHSPSSGRPKLRRSC